MGAGSSGTRPRPRPRPRPPWPSPSPWSWPAEWLKLTGDAQTQRKHICASPRHQPSARAPRHRHVVCAELSRALQIKPIPPGLPLTRIRAPNASSPGVGNSLPRHCRLCSIPRQRLPKPVVCRVATWSQPVNQRQCDIFHACPRNPTRSAMVGCVSTASGPFVHHIIPQPSACTRNYLWAFLQLRRFLTGRLSPRLHFRALPTLALCYPRIDSDCYPSPQPLSGAYHLPTTLVDPSRPPEEIFFAFPACIYRPSKRALHPLPS